MNRRSTALLTRLRRVAETIPVRFSSELVLHHSVLGIDGTARKLLYLNEGLPPRLVDLHQVRTCSINIVYSNIEAGGLEENNVEQFIDQIFLRLSVEEQKNIDLLFYKRSRDDFSVLQPLWREAKKWKIIISQLLEPSAGLLQT